MITWKEACDHVGFDESALGPMVRHKYFAYRGGIAKEFSNATEAYTFSQMVETVQIPLSVEESKEWLDKTQQLELAAVNVWISALELEYPQLTKEVFKLCYEQSYQEAYTYGYDEIANNLKGIADFAERLLKLAQDGKAK